VIEESGQPQPDQVMHPVGIKIVVQLEHDIAGGRDVLQFAQHAGAAVGDGMGKQPALLMQFDVVSALGGGQDRDDDANDRDNDHDADRRGADRAPASVILALTILRESCQRLSPHGRPPRLTC
jgi:hypothetical protein